jgi:hypothetical protein
MKRLIYAFASLALVCAALFFLLRGERDSAPGPVPEMVTLLPADSSYVVYADLATLRASPLVEQLAALAAPSQQDPDYAAFVTQTGFDYSRDLDRVALTIRPGLRQGSTLVIAEGRFDRDKIATYALRTGRLEKQDVGEVYVLPGSAPTETIAFSFSARNRIVITDAPRLAPLTPNALDPAMLDRVARVAGSAFFAVGRFQPPPQDFSINTWRSEQLDSLLRSLRWFAIAARPVDDRLKIVLDAECDTPENARQLAGALDALRIFIQAALADPKARRRIHPATLALVDSLLRRADISQRESGVRLMVELTRETLSGALGAPPQDTTPRRR